jgi:hypothetical protein
METGDSEFTYENLANQAQKYLANHPVVVLGSGATIPYGLPSMSDLATLLLKEIDGKNPPGWIDFSKQLNLNNDLEKTLNDVQLPEETVEVLVSTTWKIISSYDLEFFNQLLARQFEFPLANLFRYLLTTAGSHIHVVTTNYDRLAEYAANYIEAYVSTGITTGWLQRFNPTSVEAESCPKLGYQGHVNLLKVHGSLDWFRDVNGNILGIPLVGEIPHDMHPLVVTPGTMKYREVHKDPFRTIMSASDTILRNASCFLCVGYGFNDEHVQPILVNRVRKNDIPLVLVTKQLSESTRMAFLTAPPKKFIFFEEAGNGTLVHIPEKPEGVYLDGISVWQLGNFMKMIIGEKVR